jgi:pimeloyl-ACP methyl ester carboxylesterase
MNEGQPVTLWTVRHAVILGKRLVHALFHQGISHKYLEVSQPDLHVHLHPATRIASITMAESKPQSYTIHVPDEQISRLKQKLALTDFPTEVTGAEPWARGPPLADIRRLVEKWGTSYDWRKAEAELNKIPQYTTKIVIDDFGTYDVHFVHSPSQVKNAIPLLFAHGWPGSFYEGLKILPLLNAGGKDFPAFHVVIPSLIDFGFSEAAGKAGFNCDQHAETCHKLMLQLGYDQYVAQGGDLGYPVVRLMAKFYPEHCKAHHVNMAAPKKPTKETFPELAVKVEATPLEDWEKQALAGSAHFFEEGTGYSKIHGTKPQTIGCLVTDSPMGLLTWIYEKLRDWSDHTTYTWDDEEVLTWISIYYFSRPGPAATQRIYYEESHKKPSAFERVAPWIDVPLGVSLFKDLAVYPMLWHETMGPLMFRKRHNEGGHFAAHEQPEMLVGDLREMFGKGGGAYGVVKGKDGYEG